MVKKKVTPSQRQGQSVSLGQLTQIPKDPRIPAQGELILTLLKNLLKVIQKNSLFMLQNPKPIFGNTEHLAWVMLCLNC